MRSIHPATHGLQLRDLLPEAHFTGGAPPVVSCASDSREVAPGDWFFALEGARHDGHDHLEEAVRRGAAGVVVERWAALPVPQCVVEDSRLAFGRVSHALAGNPSRSLCVAAVTGTNGKTTTSHLLATIFRTAGARCGLMGTLGNHDGFELYPARLTTPAACEIASHLADVRDNGCSHAVLELSSHSLAQRRTAGLELDVAIITNVRRDHLDFHRTLFNYRQAKRRILEHLKPGGCAVVNADDAVCRQILPALGRPTLTYGLHHPADVFAEVVERHAGEQTFLLTAGDETIPVRTRMIGDHHVSNCLAAATTGLLLGIDLPTIVRGLEAVTKLPGRMEPIVCGQPFGVYVDYAHTPDALAAALAAARGTTRGRVICVFGAGGDRDREKRPLMGRAVERGADLGIITNDNPRGEEPLQIAHDILDGYQRPARAHVLPDRAEAIYYALGMARPGDCVLIAGKGHEQCQTIGRRQFYFDDREVVRAWLADSTAPLLDCEGAVTLPMYES